MKSILGRGLQKKYKDSRQLRAYTLLMLPFQDIMRYYGFMNNIDINYDVKEINYEEEYKEYLYNVEGENLLIYIEI